MHIGSVRIHGVADKRKKDKKEKETIIFYSKTWLQMIVLFAHTLPLRILDGDQDRLSIMILWLVLTRNDPRFRGHHPYIGCRVAVNMHTQNSV